VESIPFLAGSMDELKILHKYVRPEYERITARNNQRILYMVPWPTQYLHLKVKVSTVEGLKNIKIRVPDKGGVETLNALGMAPIHDSLGRDDSCAGVGCGRWRCDLGGVRRRRQVSGSS